MSSNRKEVQQMVEKARQMTAGQYSGELWLDVSPQEGFIRIKLRNIQPPEAMPQLISGFCYVLANGGAMFNLQVKQHVREAEGADSG